MSFEVTTAFVQQYSGNVQHLVEQKGSRLRRAVAVESNVVGKTAYFDQIGSVAAQRVTNRHGDSPLNSTPHARRRVAMWDYDTGDLIDDFDKVRTLVDLTNPYAVAHGNAMGRAIDDEIIAAAFATSYTGEDGTTTVAFPSAQQIAVDNWDYGTGSGNAGLTISKLISAKTLLDEAEADEDEQRYIACSGKQIANLLATTETTSADYNTVKALVEGKINHFMGFDFIRTQRLLTDASTYRRVMAWNQSGIKLGIGKDIKARVTERGDKRFSMYAYYCMTIGATRMEEEKVVEIKCAE